MSKIVLLPMCIMVLAFCQISCSSHVVRGHHGAEWICSDGMKFKTALRGETPDVVKLQLSGQTLILKRIGSGYSFTNGEIIFHARKGIIEQKGEVLHDECKQTSITLGP